MKKIVTIIILAYFFAPKIALSQTMRQVAASGTAITRLPSISTNTVSVTDTIMVFRNGRWEKTTAGAISGGGSVSSVSGTSPIVSSGGTTPAISILNAAADGTTKGAASFAVSDFNSSSGNITIDYASGQSAATGTKGFLTSTDWNTFNNKWGLTGNSGTDDAINFIGTTDAEALIFKWNNQLSGVLGGNSTAFGHYALLGGYSLYGNSAFGPYSMYSKTSGTNNLAAGLQSLYSNASGSDNVALGPGSFYTSTSSSGCVGIGSSAGFYETGSNKLFIDNSARGDESNARNTSMIYGVFGSTVATQSLSINAQLKINDGTGSTGDVFTKKSDGYGSWQAPYSNWTAIGNDIYNNNSAGVAIGTGIAYPLASKMFINAPSGKTGLEIATTNSLGLSILSGTGGIDLYNASAASFGLKGYSNGDGLIMHALGTGAQISSPGLVLKSENSGVLSENSTDVGISFEDNLTLGAYTATGNFMQITCNNASTRNPFSIINNGTYLFNVGYHGRVGIGTNAPSASLELASTYSIAIKTTTTNGGVQSDGVSVTNTNTVTANTTKGVFANISNNGSGTTTTYGLHGVTAGGTYQYAVFGQASSGTNAYGGYFTAQSGTNNYALVTQLGKVGFGTITPETQFEIQGAEATDASILLDADDGDDNADAWSIKSEATTNDFSLTNHTTKYLTLTSDGRLYGSALHNNTGDVTGTTNQYICSGTYTPTITNGTNISATTAYKCQWMRVGNVVTVSGRIDIDITTTLLANSLNITLPINSNFTEFTSAGGTANSAQFDQTSNISLMAQPSGSVVQFLWTGQTDTNNRAFFFTFTYLIE